VLVNISFKVRGEPIVCMPEDARCFLGYELWWSQLHVSEGRTGSRPEKQGYSLAFELDWDRREPIVIYGQTRDVSEANAITK
jgi:hypothetical protein